MIANMPEESVETCGSRQRTMVARARSIRSRTEEILNWLIAGSREAKSLEEPTCYVHENLVLMETIGDIDKNIQEIARHLGVSDGKTDL